MIDYELTRRRRPRRPSGSRRDGRRADHRPTGRPSSVIALARPAAQHHFSSDRFPHSTPRPRQI